LKIPNDPVLQVDAVCKSFKEGDQDHRILDNLNLTAGKGEFIAVTGPSGSGKSTLLNLLAGIDLPDSGLVSLLDADISSFNESERTVFRRHNIGVIFQFFNLVPTLTVAENMLLPLALTNQENALTTVERWLERFALLHRKNAYPEVLSGGEQQRIAIARAAIHSPSLILADEPTGNLDRNSGAEVLALLQQLVNDGACVIMVTHNEVAAAAADQELTLRDGRLESV
jgi:putative ABC transport system ATP-binding protein